MTTLKYNIVASGSSGNAIIYHENILVDLGVAYEKIAPFLPNIKYLLLTHKHGDHFNISAITRLAENYPEIKIIGNRDVMDILYEYRLDNLFVIESNQWVELGDYTIATADTIHNEPNVAYRINKPIFVNGKYVRDYKLFHSTDTEHLFNIEAKGCDAYFIEFNHCEDIINEKIKEKKLQKVYAYEKSAKINHQSNQRACKWLAVNNTKNALVVPLHISTKNNTIGEVEKYV